MSLDHISLRPVSLAVGEPKGRINWVLTHPAAPAKSANHDFLIPLS